MEGVSACQPQPPMKGGRRIHREDRNNRLRGPPGRRRRVKVDGNSKIHGYLKDRQEARGVKKRPPQI